MQTYSSTNDAPERAQVTRLPAKYPVIRMTEPMSDQIRRCSHEHHRGGSSHPDPEQVANDVFYLLIIPRIFQHQLDSPRDAFVNHLQSEYDNDETENDPEHLGFRFHQHARADY